MKKYEYLLLNNNEELLSLPHDINLSSVFDRIEADVLHFKNVNFNIIPIPILMKLKFNIIKFEKCIIGNFHYLDFINAKEVHFKDQTVDYYINSINLPKSITYDNIDFSNVSIKYYSNLSVTNYSNINDVIKNIHIKDLSINKLYLNDNSDLNCESFQILSQKIESKKIVNLFINNIQIRDLKHLNTFLRKFKIKRISDL
jgi:hypothetical protein